MDMEKGRIIQFSRTKRQTRDKPPMYKRNTCHFVVEKKPRPDLGEPNVLLEMIAKQKYDPKRDPAIRRFMEKMDNLFR